MHRSAALLLLVLAAGCASPADDITYDMTMTPDNLTTAGTGEPVPLDPSRPVSERDCSRPIDLGGGNLRCR
jgi:hypothetical protein